MKKLVTRQKGYILSISFCYHDSCITISDRKSILLHLEAERVFRIKHVRFRSIEDVEKLVKEGLKYLNININDIDELLITEWNNLFEENNFVLLGKKFEPIITGHHENHIGTSYPSKFEDCLILCSDGGSEDGATKLYKKNGKNIEFIEDLDDRPFTGRFYGTLTQMVIEPKCSRAHNSSAGKLMGLSSCGEFDQELYDLLEENWSEMNKLHFNGCEHLVEKFGLTFDYSKPWEDERRKNLAYVGHNYWVDKCSEYLSKYSHISDNICLVGGCALNISLNSKLLDDNIFKNVYVGPISTDAGQSLGAILYRYPEIKCRYSFLGRGEETIEGVDIKEIIEELLNKKIISWYQGRSEIGARALGHRSFIGIPTSLNMKKRISEEIKGREPYRPVSVMIPKEYIADFFEQSYSSPYMTFCSKAKQITKEVAPAIVHYDGTTRVQTLGREDNEIIYDILIELGKKTGVPMLMNTSFNVMGEPIVDSEEDAINTHLNSKSDILYINGRRWHNE